MGLEEFNVSEDITTHSRGGRGQKYPDLSKYQIDLLTGMLVSDSSLGKQEYGNPFIITQMTNKEYMEWLDRELGELSTGVESSSSGKSEYSKKSRYVLRTIRHPILESFDWINDNGNKIVPPYIRFNSTVMKIWYCGDGSLSWDGRYDSRSCIFSSTLEHNLKVISMALDSAGIDNSINSDNVHIPVDEVNKFLDWIGDAPPGFKYKWESDSYERYLKLKDQQ